MSCQICSSLNDWVELINMAEISVKSLDTQQDSPPLVPTTLSDPEQSECGEENQAILATLVNCAVDLGREKNSRLRHQMLENVKSVVFMISWYFNVGVYWVAVF